MSGKTLFFLAIFSFSLMAGCISNDSWKKDASFVSPASSEAFSGFVKPRKYLSLPASSQLCMDGADILLEVDSVRLRFGEIMAEVKQNKGRVINSQIAKIGGDKYFAYMIVKVPKKEFGDFIKQFDSFGNILKQGMTKRECPFDIQKIKLKMKNCNREEIRLKSVLKKSKKIDEIIRLERRLSEIKEKRAELKSNLIAAKQFGWFSVVNLYLKEKESIVPILIWGLIAAIIMLLAFFFFIRR